MSVPALEVTKLTKHYGDFTAVNGISFEVPQGSVIGLLGPNGAGKSTTIQMLMGITTPTSGSIKYFGDDFETHRQKCLQRINYTSAYNFLQARITVKENLMVFANLYCIKNAKQKITEYAEYFGVDKLMDQRFRNLSAGQRTRVNIAKALLNDPQLVMMDEPTASLDPDVRDRVMALIEKLRVERGISILYTSHNMDEIVRLCDSVVFLDQGNVLRQASPAELASEAHEPFVAVRFAGDGEALLSHFGGMGTTATLEERDLVVLSVSSEDMPRVLGSLTSLRDVRVLDVDLRKPTLESAFVQFSRSGDGVLAED